MKFLSPDSPEYLTDISTLVPISVYGYCENEPIEYVDPEGTRIIIKNRRDYGEAFLNLLQKITDDKVKFANDYDGEITLVMRSKYKRKIGTRLLRRLFKSRSIVTLQAYSSVSLQKNNNSRFLVSYPDITYVYYSKNKYHRNIGAGGIVEIDFYNRPKSIPLYIVLAHELIHAYRATVGLTIHKDITYKNVPIEEYLTIGLNFKKCASYKFFKVFKSKIVTENRIRKENGLPLRTSYFSY